MIFTIGGYSLPFFTKNTLYAVKVFFGGGFVRMKLSAAIILFLSLGLLN